MLPECIFEGKAYVFETMFNKVCDKIIINCDDSTFVHKVDDVGK